MAQLATLRIIIKQEVTREGMETKVMDGSINGNLPKWNKKIRSGK